MVRALARVDLGGDRAQLRARSPRVAAPARAVRGGEGRRLRPRRGAGGARRAGGRRDVAGRRDGGARPRELRAAGIEGPLLVMGALSRARS